MPVTEDQIETPAPFWTVSIYLVDRAYGGPEEGGWWYDCGERQDQPLGDTEQDTVNVLQVVRTEAEAIALAEKIQVYLEVTANLGRRSISSVLSTGRYHAQAHPGHPPAHYPERKPRYE